MDPIRLTLSSPTETYSLTTNEGRIKIGRSETCHFCVPREDLSREHCLLEVIEDQYYITDLGSKNGVYVDRIQITPHHRMRISPDSVVVLSSIYTLKINAMEVKTKIDLLRRSRLPPEMKTTTFMVDIPEGTLPIEEVKPSEKNHSKKRREPKTSRDQKQGREHLIMLVAFLAVLFLILYHALGK